MRTAVTAPEPAGQCVQALSQMEELEPDIVVMDINIPAYERAQGHFALADAQ